MKALTISDFSNDYQHLVVRGTNNDTATLKDLVDNYYSHIREEVEEYLHERNSTVILAESL